MERRGRHRLYLAALLALTAWPVACATRPAATPAPAAGVVAPSPPRYGPDYSNIHAGDYVGPEVCADCHDEQYASWRGHPHGRMNQDPDAGTILGDFSGVVLDYAGTRTVFERDGEDYVMTLAEGGQRRRYRVTRTVGSRFMQMYVGVQVEGPEPPGSRVYEGEYKLPFGYWFRRQRWFPADYFDTDYGEEFGADGRLQSSVTAVGGADWERNCIYCHNTYPYEERLWGGVSLEGFPEEDLTLHLEPHEELLTAHGQTPQDAEVLLERRARVRRGTLSPEALVTLGISCESCHFGGREHVEEDQPIRFVPTSPVLEFAASHGLGSGRTSAYAINSICAQCHNAPLVSLYPNGAGTWNSREAEDLRAGACASQARCTHCHDPHVAGPLSGGSDLPRHQAACLGCHQTLAAPAAQAAHTRHAPGSATCLDCHMPRITQGLNHVIRSHLISSPSDPRMLSTGAPNACNLCHLDRPITWTLEELARGWETRIEAEPSWADAYAGDLATPVGTAWVGTSAPVVRLVAADAFGRSPLVADPLAGISVVLEDPVPVNRMFAMFAAERALGRRLDPDVYDPMASAYLRAAQVRALLAGEPPPNLATTISTAVAWLDELDQLSRSDLAELHARVHPDRQDYLSIQRLDWRRQTLQAVHRLITARAPTGLEDGTLQVVPGLGPDGFGLTAVAPGPAPKGDRYARVTWRRGPDGAMRLDEFENE